MVADVLLVPPERQHVALSSLSQVPSHTFLVLTILPSSHLLLVFDAVLVFSLKPRSVSAHFVLQQTAESVLLQVPAQEALVETTNNSDPLGQVLGSFVVAPSSLKPLVHFCKQQVLLSAAAQEDPAQYPFPLTV